ncbi:MAG: hypothetical protein J5857_04705 [Treponema sp.]|nr:hypothetical protein [Treponema sp.]
MKNLRRFAYCLVLICSTLLISCEFWQQPVREYLEYWTTTCQVGKTEYLTPYTELDGSPTFCPEPG